MEKIINSTTYDLLTVDELAGLLRLSRMSIYRLTGKGQIPFFRLRGGIRFSRADVNDFLKKNYRVPAQI